MDKDTFFKLYCCNCGTQRCDGTEEWLEGCNAYLRHVKGIVPEDEFYALKRDKNEEKQGFLPLLNKWKCKIEKYLQDGRI